MSHLLNALNEYFISEFGTTIEKLPDDGIISLAYTTYDFDDEEREIQVFFDFKNLEYLNYIDDELVLKRKVDNIQDFINDIKCGFNEIICECLDKGSELYNS